MEALKAIKIIGNQNDGRAVFLCLPNTGSQRVLNFMRDPKLAHILVCQLQVVQFAAVPVNVSTSNVIMFKNLDFKFHLPI